MIYIIAEVGCLMTKRENSLYVVGPISVFQQYADQFTEGVISQYGSIRYNNDNTKVLVEIGKDSFPVELEGNLEVTKLTHEQAKQEVLKDEWNPDVEI